MKRKFILLSILFLCRFLFVNAQIGGTGVYTFLQLPTSAHVSALGGNNISLVTNEPSVFFQNPSLLNDSSNNIAFLSTDKYMADIYYGTAGYTFNIKKLGNVMTGIQYFNYGKFDRMDEVGNAEGFFYASDYALYLSLQRKLADSLFSYGISLKPVLSSYDDYRSFGIVADIGLLYYNPNQLLSMALCLKNAGTEIKPYYNGHYEPVDYDVEFGVTKKLKHAPLRLSLTLQHLEHWDMSNYSFSELNETTVLGDTANHKSNISKWSDEALRHIIVATDVVLSKNFYAAFGYNFQHRKELATETRLAMTGFSWGFGFKISKFQLHYAHLSYHLGGASNMITISSRINDWYK